MSFPDDCMMFVSRSLLLKSFQAMPCCSTCCCRSRKERHSRTPRSSCHHLERFHADISYNFHTQHPAKVQLCRHGLLMLPKGMSENEGRLKSMLYPLKSTISMDI